MPRRPVSLCLPCKLLGLLIGLSSQVGEWGGGAGELIADLGGVVSCIWVDNVVLIVVLSGKEVKEGLLVSLFSDLGTSLPHGFLLLLLLCHPEENVKQTESGDDEHYEEVHDLESNVSLLLEVVPLVGNWHSSQVFNLSFHNLLILHNLKELVYALSLFVKHKIIGFFFKRRRINIFMSDNDFIIHPLGLSNVS